MLTTLKNEKKNGIVKVGDPRKFLLESMKHGATCCFQNSLCLRMDTLAKP